MARPAAASADPAPSVRAGWGGFISHPSAGCGWLNGERKSPYISSPKKSLNLLVLTGPGNAAPESETQVGSAGCRGARRNRDVGRPDSKRDHLAACTPQLSGYAPRHNEEELDQMG